MVGIAFGFGLARTPAGAFNLPAEPTISSSIRHLEGRTSPLGLRRGTGFPAVFAIEGVVVVDIFPAE